jgi:hypothetical protein
MGLIALVFSTAVVFFGYRLFLFLIPIWGFFFGFGIGAQTVQYIFGEAFLASITSWIVGFIVALIFAGLSYLFYLAAVAILAGSLGYGVTVSLLAAIGMNADFLVWLIAIVVAIIVAVVVLRFNIQKYVIIIASAVSGTGAIILTMLGMFGNADLLKLVENPVQVAIDNSFLWMLFFVVVALLGIVFQIQANRNWEIESYNRWADMNASPM